MATVNSLNLTTGHSYRFFDFKWLFLEKIFNQEKYISKPTQDFITFERIVEELKVRFCSKVFKSSYLYLNPYPNTYLYLYPSTITYSDTGTSMYSDTDTGIDTRRWDTSFFNNSES